VNSVPEEIGWPSKAIEPEQNDIDLILRETNLEVREIESDVKEIDSDEEEMRFSAKFKDFPKI